MFDVEAEHTEGSVLCLKLCVFEDDPSLDAGPLWLHVSLLIALPKQSLFFPKNTSIHYIAKSIGAPF